jgi:hypothetical protein
MRDGAHLVQSLHCVPHAKPGKTKKEIQSFDVYALLAEAQSCAVAGKNAPHAPYGDVFWHSRGPPQRASKKPLPAESVLIATKLLEEVARTKVQEEFAKMWANKKGAERAKVTHIVMIVAPEDATKLPPRSTPSTSAGMPKGVVDLEEWYVRFPADAGDLEAAPDADLPPFYPLAVKHVRTRPRS